MEAIFEPDVYQYNAIVLVDSSASTLDSFKETSVFDRMLAAITELPESHFRLLFWNSDKDKSQTNFPGGTFKIPYLVEKSKMNQPFTIAKNYITSGCLTCPHLAFQNIPVDWISKNGVTKIYYVSDGQMGWSSISDSDQDKLKIQLSNAIKFLFDRFSNIQLHMITVQPRDLDFTNLESLNNAAGCDVYQVIVENQLTKYVTKFISYTLNNPNGFTHISKTIPPPGYVPFGDNFFSEVRTQEFVSYLIKLIKDTPVENDLLKIVQNLSATLSYLTKDKPQHMIREIINTFCNLFQQTVIDPMFVQFILSDAVEKENAGQANVFAVYRTQMKELFKTATNLLNKNTKDAIGIGQYFISLPIHGKIVSGHYRLIDKDLMIAQKRYPQSALDVNGILVPIIPFDYPRQSAMNEQCLRQWIRTMISEMYGVNALDDSIIYIVLGIVLRVVSSDVSELVKSSFRRIGTIMLQKKRLNSNTTELARLLEGNAPIPNSGRIQDFYDYMYTNNRLLGLNFQPMTLWYMMCRALKIDDLADKQFVHCNGDIKKDFDGANMDDLMKMVAKRISNVDHFEIPFENVLDYSCLVTLEDTATTGGYRFLQHQNLIGQICNPVSVLSADGYQALISSNNCVCPLCYTKLEQNQFEIVGPKPVASDIDVFPKGSARYFSGLALPDVKVDPNPQQAPEEPQDPQVVFEQHMARLILNKTGTLLIMKGCVGAGKSTISARLDAKIKEIGGRCIIAGMDKYCKTGMNFHDAYDHVQKEICQLNTYPNDGKPLVVIIDTCGDNRDDIFGLNFAGWKKVEYWPNLITVDLFGYLCWSLRNVLQRKQPGPNDTHWLNPRGAGVSKCIEVHSKKTRALFGNRGRIPRMPVVPTTGEGDANRLLLPHANAYQLRLNQEMKLDNQVQKLFDDLVSND